MGKIGKAKITKNSKGEENTHIMFCPDLEHFGMVCIDDDTVTLLKQCVYDMAGCEGLLNNEHLKVKGFKSYVKMHLNSAAAQAAVDSGVQLKQNPQLFMSRQVIDGRS